MKKILSFLLLPLLALNLFGQNKEEVLKPTVDLPVYFDISPPLRDMIKNPPPKADISWKDGFVKNRFFDITQEKPAIPNFMDPGLQTTLGMLPTDTTIQNFNGLSNPSGYVPPDTEGEVGPNHYFEVVNCSYAIYNKTGTKLIGPLASSTVFNGLPHNVNSGDAIVLYDEQADRWIFSQFSLPSGTTNYMMIAVSQTPDPLGSWYRYQYAFTELPDYPKFGIWPDGYYMTCNRFNISSGQFAGGGAYAYDRAAMLAGSATAVRISFTFGASAEFYGALPADCDGTFPPLGTPNYFSYVTRTGTQHLGMYEFHADYITPANSTMIKKANMNVTAFQYFTTGQGVPQLGSTHLLDVIGDRIMNRMQYRQFNGYGSMVINHTIKTNTGAAAIRWYEIQRTTGAWSIYQQGTYAPTDGRGRWMGSMAQDTAGNIALGFSISSSTMYPSIAYSGRLKNDPLNQMTIQEKRIVNGGGCQTGGGDGSRYRWGDYSSMRVDPSNPTTFWYVQQYYQTTSDANWTTQIASFSFMNVFSSYTTASPVKVCLGGSSQLNAFAYGGSGTYTYAWTSNPAGFTSDIQNPVVVPDTTTTYYVTISDGTNTRYDSARVTVQMRQTVFAGNDTLVNKFVPSIQLHAVASNYRIIGWVTSGDGSFGNTSELVTTYTPGNADRNSGSVNLMLVALPVLPCSGNVMDTLHVTFDEFVAVSDPGKKVFEMNLRPNPARSNVAVIITGTQNQSGHLTLTDISGKVVYSEDLLLNEKTAVRNLDVSNYAKGVYIVQLKTDTQVKTERLIVQ